MLKKRLLLITSIVLLLCILFTGCNSTKNEEKVLYTVQIETIGGLPLEDVMVIVYTDSELKELQWKAETDKNGIITFDAKEQDSYYIVIEEVLSGYKIEDCYEISDRNAKISLETVLTDSDDISATTFKLGSVVGNFTVTATDGNELKVSEILKTKRAIVLNFWFLNCQPCKMEFPYLQQAYADYQGKLEVIAINPVDGTIDDINTFASENQLSFPMVKLDGGLNFDAYPTTVVIDRYGTICMIHRGSITSKEEFVKVFEYFTADDYKQTLIKNISDIK